MCYAKSEMGIWQASCETPPFTKRHTSKPEPPTIKLPTQSIHNRAKRNRKAVMLQLFLVIQIR